MHHTTKTMFVGFLCLLILVLGGLQPAAALKRRRLANLSAAAPQPGLQQATVAEVARRLVLSQGRDGQALEPRQSIIM